MLPNCTKISFTRNLTNPLIKLQRGGCPHGPWLHLNHGVGLPGIGRAGSQDPIQPKDSGTRSQQPPPWPGQPWPPQSHPPCRNDLCPASALTESVGVHWAMLGEAISLAPWGHISRWVEQGYSGLSPPDQDTEWPSSAVCQLICSAQLLTWVLGRWLLGQIPPSPTSAWS